MGALNIKMELMRVMLDNLSVDPSTPIGDGNSAVSFLTTIVKNIDHRWKSFRDMLRLLRGKDNGKTSAATQRMCEHCFLYDPTKKMCLRCRSLLLSRLST